MNIYKTYKKSIRAGLDWFLNSSAKLGFSEA